MSTKPTQTSPLLQKPLKKTPLLTAEHQRRLIGVALFLLLLFSLLIIQFFRIQIVQHEKWEQQAYAQHTVTVKEPCKRGVFYSNAEVRTAHPSQPQPLVIDILKFHLYVDPRSIPEECKLEMIQSLTRLLQLEGEDLAYMKKQFFTNYRSRKIVNWLNSENKEKVHLWWQDYCKSHAVARNALYFIKQYQRCYPFGKLLGQVLHTVREFQDEGQELVPTGGLEYVFNEFLKGKPGKRLLYRSPRHAMDRGRLLEAPQNGADIYLTVDHVIQTILEEEIETQVKKAEAKRGWAILMDPHTGEVFALAQYPFFAPQEYKTFFNDPQLLEETQLKAIVDPYEPGSTMKLVTMAVCLTANEERKKQGKPPIFDPMEKLLVLPTPLPGRTKPIKDTRTHRYMNMYMSMQKSSNVYMAKTLNKVLDVMGDEWYRNLLSNLFQFGVKTGIELPAESGGLLPTPGKTHPNGTLEWSKPTPYSLAMGHNILANSFQMLRCFAMFANGGYEVKPTLIKKIIETQPDGTEKNLWNPTVTKKERLIDPYVMEQLLVSLKYVTKEGGAARKADIHGYTEAGKTSTSEKIVNGVYSKKNHISTFIGFAPVVNPRFVLLIAIDEPAHKFIPGVGSNQMGGNCAAPAFQRAGKRVLEYLEQERDDPYGYPKGDPRYDDKKADWSFEVKALNRLYKKWND